VTDVLSDLSSHIQLPWLALEYLLVLPILIYLLRRSQKSEERLNISARVITSVVLIFAIAGLLLSYLAVQGMLIPDEIAYDFQARIFASGHLMASPLPGSVELNRPSPAEIHYDHHIEAPYGWFTKYPPGWPLVLAIGNLAHMRWALNPLLALCLLLLTYFVGKHLFSRDVGLLAVLLCASSPFFIINSVGLMSHILSSICAAGAVLLLLRALRTGSLALFAAAFALLAIGFHIRPYTGFLVSVVLGIGTLYLLRDNPLLFRRVLGLGFLFAALTLITLALYNHAYTGKVWLSPYALASRNDNLRELTLDPHKIYGGLRTSGRRAFQETLFSTFPFMFLMAGYSLLKEKSRRTEVWTFAMLYVALVLGYTLHWDGSGIHWGERFHFEAFFAVAILAARGIELLAENWKLARSAVVTSIAVLFLLQLPLDALLARYIIQKRQIYSQIRVAANASMREVSLVFLEASEHFVARHFNLNQADWQKSPCIFLIDPGVSRRNEVACRFGRPQWAVLTYDETSRKPVKQEGIANCKDMQGPGTPRAGTTP
jgi:hypothetical protein